MQMETPYSKAITRKYPEAVAIAVARSPEGRDNPITLGWSMITSGDPPMFAMAVALGHYSREIIEQAGEFVLSFPSLAMAEAALYFGTHSGREVDKLKSFPLPTQRASSVDTVLFSDAVANFECKLDSQLVTGDHMLFVGRVVKSHVNQDADEKRLYTLKPGFVMGRAEAVPLEE